MPDSVALPASPLHALSVYAEPLVVGRRVVVFGSAASRLGERILDMGARVVHVYDPRPLRSEGGSERAPRGLIVQPLPAGDFDVRDGAFDVAIIADLGEIPSPAALILRMRKLLSPGGAALVRSRNPEASLRDTRPGQASPDYYELYDLVSMQFAHVRMIGQIPWTGALLCELGRTGDEPDVTVDTQLVEGADTPEAFIALCSQDDIKLAEYALVQLPSALAIDVGDTEAPGSERADLAAAQLRASLLEAQVEELRVQRNADGAAHADSVATLEGELAYRLTELQGAEDRASEANARVERAAAELRAQSEELARVKERATVAAREIDEERNHRSRAERDLAVSRRSVDTAAISAQGHEAALVRVAVLEAALVELDARAAAASQRAMEVESRAPSESSRVAELEAEVAMLAEGLGAELVAFEEALRERAQTVHALEKELGRRERIVHDLVQALDEARAGETEGPSEHQASHAAAEVAEAEAGVRRMMRQVEQARSENAELRQKLDAAALEIARREGESTTSAWRIQELEQEVARLDDEQSELTMTIPPPAFVQVEREANDPTNLATRLSAAEDELDVLRQALAQEHAARARAESGEALEQARTELARQAALLEKLSRELEAHDGVRRPTDGGAGDAASESV